MKIHRLTVPEALASIHSRTDGLTGAQAAKRLAEYGPNRLAKIRKKPLSLLFLRQFTHFFALILLLAAVLAFVAEALAPGQGMLTLALAILGVILVNGVFSFWQEFRAEKALAALERLLPHTVKALRDGAATEIPSEEVVPGDVVAVEEGDDISADCRLIEAFGLRVNLATVTGESLPKARDTKPSAEENALRADNILLAGTSVVSGRGKAVVYATGTHTEFSRIAHLTQAAAETPSPLQRQIVRATRGLGLVAALVGVAFFLVGQFVGLSFWANFTFAIGILVAFVPEGLLPTVTLSLAMGAQRMARRNALIRHLPAVEALGSVTVICTDKTGTLTQNRMAARKIYFEGKLRDAGELNSESPAGRECLAVAANCHTLRLTAEGKPLGDPMEAALYALGETPYPAERVDELPFDTDRKRLTVLVRSPEGLRLLTKGAPETVLPLCDTLLEGKAPAPLDAAALARFQEMQAQMAVQGYRVLALAVRAVAEGSPPQAWERGMMLVGLAGIEDPPRPEVAAALAKCREAGIRVIMVTGDHPVTGLAIARDIGMVMTKEPRIVTGSEMAKLSDIQLQLALDAPEILFARLSADQKLRIVNALKRKGEIVGVTGDGVNDAPALKSADVGIAMGLSGTEVAREAADMVLLDDNFATIVAAVEEGRAIFENIKKFLTYHLTSNIPEAVPYLAFVLFGIPLPLTIVQILAVDLGTDLLPALALGAEKGHHETMRQPPRPRSARLLDWQLLLRSYCFLGVLEAAACMAAFFYVLDAGGWRYGAPLGPRDPLYLAATTATLTAIVVTQVVNLFLCRESRRSSLSVGFFQNRLIWWGISAELTLILLIDYTPWGNELFGTAPLGAGVWLYLLPFAAGMAFLEEARKWGVRRFGTKTAA